MRVGWRQHWPAVRALLVALIIVVGLVDGLPLPNNKRTPPAMLPTVKQLRKLRTQFMTPFRPVREAFRMHQQWRLFPTASLKQHRLWVEGRTDRKAESGGKSRACARQADCAPLPPFRQSAIGA